MKGRGKKFPKITFIAEAGIYTENSWQMYSAHVEATDTVSTVTARGFGGGILGEEIDRKFYANILKHQERAALREKYIDFSVLCRVKGNI